MKLIDVLIAGLNAAEGTNGSERRCLVAPRAANPETRQDLNDVDSDR